MSTKSSSYVSSDYEAENYIFKRLPDNDILRTITQESPFLKGFDLYGEIIHFRTHSNQNSNCYIASQDTWFKFPERKEVVSKIDMYGYSSYKNQSDVVTRDFIPYYDIDFSIDEKSTEKLEEEYKGLKLNTIDPSDSVSDKR